MTDLSSTYLSSLPHRPVPPLQAVPSLPHPSPIHDPPSGSAVFRGPFAAPSSAGRRVLSRISESTRLPPVWPGGRAGQVGQLCPPMLVWCPADSVISPARGLRADVWWIADNKGGAAHLYWLNGPFFFLDSPEAMLKGDRDRGVFIGEGAL